MSASPQRSIGEIAACPSRTRSSFDVRNSTHGSRSRIKPHRCKHDVTHLRLLWFEIPSQCIVALCHAISTWWLAEILVPPEALHDASTSYGQTRSTSPRVASADTLDLKQEIGARVFETGELRGEHQADLGVGCILRVSLSSSSQAYHLCTAGGVFAQSDRDLAA